MKPCAPSLHREIRSFLSSPPPFRLPNKPRRHSPFTVPSNPFAASRAAGRRRSCSLAASSVESKLEASWISADGSSNDGFGGWSVAVGRPETEDRDALPKFKVVGVGTTVAVLLAAFTWFSYSRKGFKFQLDVPFHTLYELLLPSERTKDPVADTESPALEVNQFSEADLADKADVASNTPKLKEDNLVAVLGENKRIIVPVAADSTQHEALFVLKKLKIIENDANANELCTRREYARWLVKANSMLERNPKYRIAPLTSIASSMVTSFDDVSVNDPDFWCIQALGEAGIVLSKLSAVNCSSFSDVGNSDGQGRVGFSPDSFISQFDLVNWKTLLEYSFTSEMDDKMLKKVGFLDLNAIIPYASPQLLADLMAGDKSITRRVFGNIRRLQPHKPVTKAQAAVALTSGRMAEAIHNELSRLDAENLSRLAEMDEIKSELICRGEIQRLWEEKLNKERDRGFEVERDLQIALHDLQKEKLARAESFAVHMKDKAAVDCQQQLLLHLREEVDGMYDRLTRERANLMSEQQSLEKLFVDLQEKQDAVFEVKSILEAEKEALQILRSWLEEEARRIQVRAKILEQAAQRWKWNDESTVAQPCSPESKDS